MPMDTTQLARLADAFAYRCTSAWLGYGTPLFLGFGGDELPSRVPIVLPSGKSYVRPPYGLDTSYAAWRVEGPITARWADDDDSTEAAQLLEAAAESLIGERVLSWTVLPDGIGLQVTFTGSKTLTIEPWPIADGIDAAWSLHAPDEQILAMANDGRTVVVSADLPIRDWF